MRPLITVILELAYARLKSKPEDELTNLGLEKTPGRKMDPIADIRGAFEYLLSKGWTQAEIFAVFREDAISKEKLAQGIAKRESISEKWAARRIGEEFKDFIAEKRADHGLKFIKGI